MSDVPKHWTKITLDNSTINIKPRKEESEGKKKK
jgi:hypothetical protein